MLKFTLEIKAESPLRIGAGRNVAKLSPIDLPVVLMRIGDRDLPYIPGSSIKGVFRSTSEFVAKSFGLDTCLMGEGCKSKYDKALQDQMKKGDVEGIKKILSSYCLVCKLYGSASFRSNITFEDAYPSSKNVPTRSVKTGIAIDRKSGAVKSGAFHQVEFIDPGAVFIQNTTFLNVPNYGIGLFSEVLDLINLGFIKLGGFKSRGFGRVSIKPKGLEGFLYQDGKLRDIKEVDKLPRADDEDEDILLKVPEEERLSSLLSKSKEVWEHYVKRNRG
ncbi:MAG: CRISPR-associated RAMP protein Csx7 [Thermoproteota archaeon]